MEINRQALIADVELYLKTYAKTYTQDAAEQFTDAAKQTIIDVFYGQYDPMYYDRTDDLKNNSYYKYHHDNGSTMYGGVIISDRDMSDYVNTWHAYDIAKGTFGESLENTHDITSITSSSKVVSWTWTKGYHGYTGGNPSNAIYTFPPIAALEMKIGEIIPKLQNNASKVAKSQQYSVLQF